MPASSEASALRVLFIHHVGILGGSSRSLFELFLGFPDGAVVPHFVLPKGKFCEMLIEREIPVVVCRGISQFDNCAYSYYRKLRWLILFRELWLLFFTYSALKQARSRWGRFDVVHINDITMPFAAWLSQRLFPESVIVVHARAVQRTDESRRKRWLRWLYQQSSDAIVAINENVSESLPERLPIHVIHNGLALPAKKELLRASTTSTFNVGMVGVISRAKGCADFIEAAAICRDGGYDIRFVFVGGANRPANGFRDRVLGWFGFRENSDNEIKILMHKRDLADVVIFKPFTTDLASVYREIDVLCFPSYLDAPGRPIFEAGFFGVPSIAAISKPKADTFIDGSNGLLIRPGMPTELARAIIKLHDNPQMLRDMGEAAKKMAEERFDAKKNAEKVLALYRRLLESKMLAEQREY